MKYNIEGNINFYDELYQSLDNNKTDDNTPECLITCLPLTDNSVTLECNHSFNYTPLYQEICKQKYVFKTYEQHNICSNDLHKLRDSKLDYFIRCPYCRNMQFTIIPYYPEMNLPEKYGINSLDISIRENILQPTRYNSVGYGHDDYLFTHYYSVFKKGSCCKVTYTDKDITNDIVLCGQKYVATILDSELTYCKYHYKNGLKEYLLGLKLKKIQDKKEATLKLKEDKKEATLKLKEDKKKQKDNEKQKILDEKNALRVASGKKPLILRKKKTLINM